MAPSIETLKVRGHAEDRGGREGRSVPREGRFANTPRTNGLKASGGLGAEESARMYSMLCFFFFSKASSRKPQRLFNPLNPIPLSPT